MKGNQFRKGYKHIEETKRKIGLASKGRKHTPETIQKIIKKSKYAWFKKGHISWNKGIKSHMRGENHPNWQGGKSFEPYSIDWTETLKRAIRERDHYLCQLCNLYGNNIHHIDYNKKNCNPDNLITLCFKCHRKTGSNRDYWENYFNNYKLKRI